VRALNAHATKSLPRDKYIKRIESEGLTLHAIASVDSISEIIFGKKPKTKSKSSLEVNIYPQTQRSTSRG
jgi:hypothetical protein